MRASERSAYKTGVRFAPFALLPVVCFWGLDAYFLWQGRLFWKLHDAVREDIGKPDDVQTIPLFSMNTAPVTSKTFASQTSGGACVWKRRC